MKKIGYRMINENSGITLISLVVTIIVIIILASIGINTGITTLKSSQLTRFTSQMKMMQLEVNELYEKYITGGTVKTKEGTKFVGEGILNIGKELTQADQEQISKIFRTTAEGGSNILDETGYRYFDTETISSLKIDGIDQEFLVNVQKRSFISFLGFKYNNDMYYTLEQLPDGLYNVGYINPNTGKPTFDVNYEKLTNGKWKINISNIKYEEGQEGYITKWNVKYQLANTEKPDKWYTSEELSFIVDTTGKYRILIYQQDVQSNIVDMEINDVLVSGNRPDIKNIKNIFYVTWNKDSSGNYIINETQVKEPVDWYDYKNGKWANIKTEANGLEAYWVWIPRFAYIPPKNTTAVQIDVKFVGIDTTSSNVEEKVGTGYTVHPAFTIGSKELSGIWVAKYEASSSSSSQVQVKPQISSWRNIDTKIIFNSCKKMNQVGGVLEGSTVDSHMMKNIEWGAVAILSQSKYGIFNPQSATGDTEGIGDKTHQIWNNSSSNYLTGSAGSGKDAKSETAVSEYNKGNGPKASTTGTVYGVYDMAGGSWEYVAGCVSGYENSKFGVKDGDSTYVDLYKEPISSNLKPGDATNETKGWNGDYAYFPYSTNPVFGRGGSYHGGAAVGVFYFCDYHGGANGDDSFRPALFP